MEKKIVIFVDGSNFAAALNAARMRVDYDKILAEYNSIGQVVNATYFTALPPKNVFAPLRGLIDRLAYNGWHIVSKEVKTNITSEGLLRDKGNMDVNIAVEAMHRADQMTDFVLFSGDGDFTCLVAKLQDKAIHCTAVSYYSHRSDCIVADELRRQVNTFINIADRKDWLTNRQPPSDKELEERKRRFLDGQ